MSGKDAGIKSGRGERVFPASVQGRERMKQPRPSLGGASLLTLSASVSRLGGGQCLGHPDDSVETRIAGHTLKGA